MVGKILDRILATMAVMAGLLLLFLAFSIGYSIFARLVGIRSPLWTVQFNEYSLLWLCFLGSAWVLKRGKHVSMDIITSRLKPPAKKVFNILHGFMGVGVCSVLFWYSLVVTWNQFQRGVTDVKAVDVPKYLVLVVIPIGFLTLGLQFARNLVASFRRAETDRGTRGRSETPGPGGVEGVPEERRG
ncbi:MAG: TRAP transporter small permease [Deltaproteobacteria bacterium]|nr:TRAP transporter small permease [Deltaproteobacteria bacterium]MBW2129345.1 TRAP transporter small permease [Deltaproteobacteria bacterium]